MSSQQTQRVVASSSAAQVTHADFALARQTLDSVQTQYGVLLSTMGTLPPGDIAALFTQLAEIKQVLTISSEGAALRGLCASLMAALEPPASPVVLAPLTSSLPPVPPLSAFRYDAPPTLQVDVLSPLAASVAEHEDSSLLEGSHKTKKKSVLSAIKDRLSRKKEATKETDEFTSLLRSRSEDE